jgi:cysteine sulfinate desulfinase/cysteine desulfurase-like protein/glyoxylase-like metal-dependent hydrolase (beta-lactamase superfamily II)/rhodanese-related sulfurtransferase
MIIRKSSEIYLDANATTPVLPEAAKEAHDAMEDLYGNPSSSHISGLRARFILESARELVQQVLGAESGQIVFTSGATEAIQMGVFSTLCDVREKRKRGELPGENRKLLYGATEHKAVPQAIRHWNQLLGVDDEVLEIPVDEHGQLDLEFIKQHAAESDLICTMAVNNETGVVTDLAAVESAIRSVNPDVAWLVDCVQAVGKLPLNLSSTSITYAAVSGHKVYAPKGIGLLYVCEDAKLVPLMAGGGQEQGARGGTENLPGVAAIAAVMKKLVQSETRTFAEPAVLQQYHEQIVSALKQAFPTIVLNSPVDHSVPTTINFSVKGFPSKELLDLFDAAGIRVSSGSACGSAVVGSYVLDAMGLEQWRSDGAIRMSFGPLTSKEEIQMACERIEQAGQALCDSCLVLSSDADAISGQELDGLIQLKNGSMCTWLLMDSKTKRCVVIDPFEELAQRTETLIRCQKSKVVAILDTHAHVDHDSCRQMLLKVIGDQAEPSAETSDLLGWPEQSDGICTLADGAEAKFMRISDEQVIVQTELPGHTTIGRAFLVGTLDESNQLTAENVEFAFTGDMILMGGIGRTDFPCSTIDEMFNSLHRLPKLITSKTLICPTHDYNNEFSTTIECELADNDYLRSILCLENPMSFEDFKRTKPDVDSKITDATNSELVCGLIKTQTCDVASVELSNDDLKSFFATHRDSLIIDVREPHEFSFAQNWLQIGFVKPPTNVPLTRLSGYLPELLKQHHENPRDVIFLCRSGRRSGKAAEVARRIGVDTARHIAGGIALNVKHQLAKDDINHPGYVI